VQNPAKWSAFVKSVLKNGLKMRELGPPCVALLAALCASKYSGLEQENTEQQLIADMLQSHSGDPLVFYLFLLTCSAALYLQYRTACFFVSLNELSENLWHRFVGKICELLKSQS
jgi:hypothetical protein